MPPVPPPEDCPGTPVIRIVQSGSLLYRVHRHERQAISPNFKRVTAPQGGRFDADLALASQYGYWYAATSELAAFAETFLRSATSPHLTPRLLPRSLISDRSISELRCERDLHLVQLHGGAEQQIGQDNWLTTCDESGYSLTRQWADSLYRWAPNADGLIWRSRRFDDEFAVMLWTRDSKQPLPVSTKQTQEFNQPSTYQRLLIALHQWRITLP